MCSTVRFGAFWGETLNWAEGGVLSTTTDVHRWKQPSTTTNNAECLWESPVHLIEDIHIIRLLSPSCTRDRRVFGARSFSYGVEQFMVVDSKIPTHLFCVEGVHRSSARSVPRISCEQRETAARYRFFSRKNAVPERA